MLKYKKYEKSNESKEAKKAWEIKEAEQKILKNLIEGKKPNRLNQRKKGVRWQRIQNNRLKKWNTLVTKEI